MRYFVIIVTLVLAAAVIWVLFFSGLIIRKQMVEPSATIQKTQAPDTSAAPTIDGQSLAVILETDFGNIKIVPDFEAAPQTAANFVKLVTDGFYNGLTFHRVIPGFVIQGGDPKGDGTGGPGHTVPAEIKLLHKRGSIAMARLSDEVNPQRESSGSQFYIALADLPQLDGQYTVFGQVTAGLAAVDKIAATPTDSFDKPIQAVKINKAYLAPAE